MNFSLSEEQTLIQQSAKRIAESELAPLAEKLDQQGDRSAFLNNLKILAENGFMGVNINEQYGGTNADTISFSLALTELGRACASTAVTTSVTNMVAEVIQSVGNEAQRSRYLPKLCSGDYAAGGFCLTESGAGSDPSAMRCSAEKTNDGWEINGAKQYITSAEFAGVFVVWAVTDKSASKGKGISCFLVEANNPGLSISKAEKKMGQHGSATNEVVFDKCLVNDAALLGELNKGFKIAVGELAGGRIGVGSLALGIGLAAIDYARAYTKERQQFGQAIANFQGLQWMLADTYTELEAAKLLLLQAAYLKDQGLPFGKAASMAKVFSTEAANKACYTALQLMGGAGYLSEYPLERYARDARITTIYEGTSEIQRVIIARELLSEIVS
jgi:alkylation response protein AidB-like acyl-CoA dehydrogenase